MITLDQLHEQIKKIIAHPHETITFHDEQRANEIFLLLDEYMKAHIDYTEQWVCVHPHLEFQNFVVPIRAE